MVEEEHQLWDWKQGLDEDLAGRCLEPREAIGLHERCEALDAAASASAPGHESVCWNWIDMVVVAACVCDQWIMPILPDAMTGHALVTFLSLLRTIRLCRIELLKKEIQIIKMMDHPNIIKSYEAFEAQVWNLCKKTREILQEESNCQPARCPVIVCLAQKFSWKMFTDTFDYLPISAVIENQTICMHGGISPSLDSLENIRQLDRMQEVPTRAPCATCCGPILTTAVAGASRPAARATPSGRTSPSSSTTSMVSSSLPARTS